MPYYPRPARGPPMQQDIFSIVAPVHTLKFTLLCSVCADALDSQHGGDLIDFGAHIVCNWLIEGIKTLLRES